MFGCGDQDQISLNLFGKVRISLLKILGFLERYVFRNQYYSESGNGWQNSN